MKARHVAIAFMLVALDAFAQVPAHTPGSICFTPKFWCWARPPGAPKAACTCPTPYGPVRGTLG
jgi:hypothetical protein